MNSISWNHENHEIASAIGTGIQIATPDNNEPFMIEDTSDENRTKIKFIKFSEYTGKLGSVDEGNTINVWHLRTKLNPKFKLMTSNKRVEGNVTDLSFSEEGKVMAIIYDDGYLLIAFADGRKITGLRWKTLSF